MQKYIVELVKTREALRNEKMKAEMLPDDI